MVKNPEAGQIAAKRKLIEAYLTESILKTGVKPSDLSSIYQQRPTRSEDLELHEQAQGDPVLYAILKAVQQAREERLTANQSGDEDLIMASVNRLADAKQVELEWRFPGDYLDED